MRFRQLYRALCATVTLGLTASIASVLATQLPAHAFPVEVAEAPTTSLDLTLSAIRSAQRSLFLNIYELTSPEIADALLERIRAGVHVVILEEGQPVGGISAAGRGIQAHLIKAMRAASPRDRLYEMSSHAGGKRRFRFNHGKYAVIDGTRLLIGSENYSPTGKPLPGTKGNRGWQVFLHHEDLAREYAEVFRSDTNLKAGDMFDLTEVGLQCRSGVPGCISGPAAWLEAWLSPWAHDTGLIPTDLETDFGRQVQKPLVPKKPAAPFAPWGRSQRLEASSVTRIVSPETSLSGLLRLLRSARQSIDLEQMTFTPEWGRDGERSPLLEAVIDAARRGVRVRVLANDESVFDRPGQVRSHKNEETVAILNRVARSERLPLQARIGDNRRMGITYIHNKGALVDGERTLISSINWNRNSIENNREGAVLITSREVYQHYLKLFESDWFRSNSKGRTENDNTAEAVSDAPSAPWVGQFQGSRIEAPQATPCPSSVRVFALIGDLVISDPDDESFRTLSRTRFDAEFERVFDHGDCLLTEVHGPHGTGASRFIQIRSRTNGARQVSLEGYTPGGKLYSIRAWVPSGTELDGLFDSQVYDASGPGRQRLGPAVLDLTVAEEEFDEEGEF